ncbi:endonuclease domain-containing 1 protein-like [Cyprinus carpio]|uniref:Endonuclease domain-containing 1 protein-like n=1 Tax=Cyprinus carpio TaxID=7962 RepID=A0A9Q9YBQ1_CYPCA|nr:endonuclease domain-containing 1 protein-like [Cyprinus carpio]
MELHHQYFTDLSTKPKICQTFKKKVYYATLYDTDNKIPVYSAYKFNKAIRCQRKHVWCIEPQDNIESTLSLMIQALGFDRGHLAPVYLASSQDCADATFTLTNAAPQNPKLQAQSSLSTNCQPSTTSSPERLGQP